jgi:hypothetical protein
VAPPLHDAPKFSTPSYFGQFKHWASGSGDCGVGLKKKKRPPSSVRSPTPYSSSFPENGKKISTLLMESNFHITIADIDKQERSNVIK